MNKLEALSKLLLQVTRVSRQEVPAGEGPKDEMGVSPQQTEYSCFIDGAEGRRFICAIYAVGTKVLMIAPFEDSGLCAYCYQMDCFSANQDEMNRILTMLLLSVDEVDEHTPEDEEMCGHAEPMACGHCKLNFSSNKPVEIPSQLLN